MCVFQWHHLKFKTKKIPSEENSKRPKGNPAVIDSHTPMSSTHAAGEKHISKILHDLDDEHLMELFHYVKGRPEYLQRINSLDAGCKNIHPLPCTTYPGRNSFIRVMSTSRDNGVSMLGIVVWCANRLKLAPKCLSMK